MYTAKLVDIVLETGKIYDGVGFNYVKKSFETNSLHLIGLLSDGGVHSRLDQLQLLLKGASERGAKKIRVHILTDGRDVLDGYSVGFVELLRRISRTFAGKNDWEVVKRGWDAQVLGGATYKF
ncbi:Phosphoglucomutase-1 [Orobanche minor]